MDEDTGDKRADLIPLGPRINLRRFALALESMGFTVRVQYIPWLANDKGAQGGAVPPSIPLNARTSIQQAAIDRAREQEEHLAPEGHRIEDMFHNMMEVEEEAPVPDESNFIYPLTAGESVQPFRQLRVFYPQGTASNGITLFETYILGPIIGNGNCFFHAAFTEAGQDKAIMENRIAQMREDLPGVVMGNPNYIFRIKGEILAEYKASRHHAAERLKKMLKQNDRRESLRNESINFLKEKYILEHPGAAYNDYDPVPEDLPDFLRTVPYSDDVLLNEISEQEVTSYMQRYVRNHGKESYITIPAGHGETSAVGTIIAEQQDVLIHCFMLNRRQGMLTYKGPIGPPNAQKAVSILYLAEHYWALYNAGESEERRRGILQAAINESTH